MIEAPDYIEPVVGWRVWRIEYRRGGARLTSPMIRTKWPCLQPLEARCAAFRSFWPGRRTHDVPDVDCQCGIHAASLEAFEEEFVVTTRGEKPRLAIGRVALWGRVVEGERGWRGEFAYPDRVFVVVPAATDAEKGAQIAAALAGYGVDIGIVRAPTRRSGLDTLVELAQAA